MTANVMKGDQSKCLEAGMDDYLPKPVDPTALADMLNEWIDKKSGTKNVEKAI